jgi:hypothetical protein
MTTTPKKPGRGNGEGQESAPNRSDSDRRTGEDRRSGDDRRSGKDRRSGLGFRPDPDRRAGSGNGETRCPWGNFDRRKGDRRNHHTD